MNLIQVQKGSKSFGARELIKDATFTVNHDEHVGVIGPNGAGKTTLFKILVGEEHLDEGEVIRSRDLRVGYLAQEVLWKEGETLDDYLESCTLPIWELKALGNDLGLEESMFSVPLNSLSGGYRMRCKLLYLIGNEPNLMMLDEPTNYLDLETLLILEKFLQNYRGAFLLISHDREFLRRTTDHTLEIENQDVTMFPGNIDDYFEEKQMLREQLEKRALSVAAKRKEVLDFARRFGAKATKARQVQSRLKSLKRMEKIEIKPLPVAAKIKIPEPGRIGKKAISVTNLNLGYGDKTILSDINLNLIRGDKIGVVGYNGAGKSTLLKGLAQTLMPQTGSVEYGMDVDIGYYAQHVAEELDFNSNVLDELHRGAHVDVTEQEVLDLAGSLLFSGDNVYKSIKKLSGGEKARVALGKILLKKVPVLLLDEVTNHLDFTTVEALTQALKNYQGTVVVISHDRSFIGRVASKILEIRDGKVLQYYGTYDEYVWSLEKGALSKLKEDIPEEFEEVPTTPKPKKKENFKEKRKFLERQIRVSERESKKVEEEIHKAQARIEELNTKLHEGKDLEFEALNKELQALPFEVISLEEKWMTILEEKESFTKELEKLINGE